MFGRTKYKRDLQPNVFLGRMGDCRDITDIHTGTTWKTIRIEKRMKKSTHKSRQAKGAQENKPITLQEKKGNKSND